MRNEKRNGIRDEVHYEHGRRNWVVPLMLLAALVIGGLIYTLGVDGSRTASDTTGTTTSAPATTGSGAGMNGSQSGAASTRTPSGAPTGGAPAR